MVRRVGILSLQGNMSRHAEVIQGLGYEAVPVKQANDLQGCSCLIIPGGESSVLLHHLDSSFELAIKEFSVSNPVLATCAGLILCAKKVTNPAQRSLGLLDIEVERNSYGRQANSFISEQVELFAPLTSEPDFGEGVFIRAPRIVKILSADVSVLAAYKNSPVVVQQGICIGASFHPELSGFPFLIHQFFLNLLSDTQRPAVV